MVQSRQVQKARGNVRGRGSRGVIWREKRTGPREVQQVDSSSSPDEAFVARWVIVTDKRMLHAQEEPGWGMNKDKIKALDLGRSVRHPGDAWNLSRL